ncbi:unnamed protein product [Blepharisma stoltei]|uniref:Ribosomal protein L20 n=1 Tax=Blepharisma stoltei TaxID=1481888 RepID=A0AAU9KDQ6_9CILI|nr:unnamed protein product [Blepharisma stoltei]
MNNNRLILAQVFLRLRQRVQDRKKAQEQIAKATKLRTKKSFKKLASAVFLSKKQPFKQLYLKLWHNQIVLIQEKIRQAASFSQRYKQNQIFQMWKDSVNTQRARNEIASNYYKQHLLRRLFSGFKSPNSN